MLLSSRLFSIISRTCQEKQPPSLNENWNSYHYENRHKPCHLPQRQKVQCDQSSSSQERITPVFLSFQFLTASTRGRDKPLSWSQSKYNPNKPRDCWLGACPDLLLHEAHTAWDPQAMNKAMNNLGSEARWRNKGRDGREMKFTCVGDRNSKFTQNLLLVLFSCSLIFFFCLFYFIIIIQVC